MLQKGPHYEHQNKRNARLTARLLPPLKRSIMGQGVGHRVLPGHLWRTDGRACGVLDVGVRLLFWNHQSQHGGLFVERGNHPQVALAWEDGRSVGFFDNGSHGYPVFFLTGKAS